MEGQFIIEQYQNFQQKLKTRQKIRISLDSKFQAELDMMEYVILSKFQKNTKNMYKQKKNKQCDKLFKRAFKELVDIEKIYYYNMIISHLQNITNQQLTPPKIQSTGITSNGYSKTYSKIGWKQVLLKIDFQKRYIYVQKDHKLKAYDLNFYIIRKSKATQYNSFVLQAINQVINQKGHQIHIGFKDVKIFRNWFEGIKKLVEYVFWQKIRNMIFAPQVVQTLATKQNDQQTRQQKGVYQTLGDSKLYQSTFTNNNSLKNIQENRQQNKLIKSTSKIPSQNESESLQKSCQSIQIKSHSPRSSIKSQQVRLQPQQNSQNQQENQCQTFRSFARLGGQDIEDFNDQSPIFRKLLPQYQLDKIQSLTHSNQLLYSTIDGKLKIYSNIQNAKKVKVFLELSKSNITKYSFEQFSALFSSPQFYKQINSQIEQITTKTILTSDHCAILYQKNNCYNRLYRCRDFVFIRHQFRKGNKIYIIDKSVQDVNIPPFTTIVRGQLSNIFQICQLQDKIKFTIDAMVQNFGYLKDLQELNINIKFFKGFENIQSKLKSIENKNISPLFEPLIKKNQSTSHIQPQFKKVQLKQVSQSQKLQQTQKEDYDNQKQSQNVTTEEQIKFIPIQTLPIETIRKHHIEESYQQPQQIAQNIEEIAQSVQKMEFQGEISMIQQPKQRIEIKIPRKFDSQGKVIIETQCFTRKHITTPYPSQGKQYFYLKNDKGQHPIWKGNWEFLQQGGFKFINKKRIQDQKNVLKFILSQVAKNLVSGKSILNISLPVDIFSTKSNLQQFVFSLGYAPIILQPATKMNQVDRFLQTAVFGMTNSPMYLQMQKPFNPIIGETFEGYINGCPVYAQQISHHPPIAAFMLIGRGYRVSAQIQSKMKLNINSGTGSNAGIFRIRYDDQVEICYTCPSGQVVGLAYGDRKFNMVGKAYCWSQQTGLFLQICFNPKKGGFFDKQLNPIDYVEGTVCQIRQSFLKSFIKNMSGSPKKNDIIKQHGKFHGRWNKQLKYQDRQLFNYETKFPLDLQYQKSPLPSDSNWRQDITYRRLQQISVAQVWKQKWQVHQRNDRKLRQKYNHQHGKK